MDATPLGITYVLKDYRDTALNIEAVFEKLVYGSINADVCGKKLDVEGNSLTDGTVITLSRTGYEDIKTTIEDGIVKLNVAKIVAGEWTASVNGYRTVKITIEAETEYSEQIVFEYYTFSARHPDWGQMISSEENDGIIGSTNEIQIITTNDTYNEVAFSMLIGGENAKKGNQGIAFYFEDGKCALLRVTGKDKIEFDNDGGQDWFTGNKADGSDWQTCISFTGENEKYLEKYDAGTLKLTCVRKGATIYVYLEGELIGQRMFNEKYADDKVKVGFYYTGMDNNVDHKWNVGIETDISEYDLNEENV